MKTCKKQLHSYPKEHKRCPECNRAAKKAYYKANPEKHKANMKAWYEANPEKHKAASEANPEKRKASIKAWREANPEKHKATLKAWKEANSEKEKANKKAWREANPGKVNADQAKRRAAKLNRTPTWLTPAQLNSIGLYYLAAKWAQDILEEPIHVDHIIPLQGKAVSGLHVPWNLQLLPASENRSKSNKIK